MASEHQMPDEREEGEIKVDEKGNVVIGAPTAKAAAPISAPEPDEEVSD